MATDPDDAHARLVRSLLVERYAENQWWHREPPPPPGDSPREVEERRQRLIDLADDIYGDDSPDSDL
ncbi:MAG: hypothetical protein QM595_11000 [Nocardioides sp.]